MKEGPIAMLVKATMITLMQMVTEQLMVVMYVMVVMIAVMEIVKAKNQKLNSLNSSYVLYRFNEMCKARAQVLNFLVVFPVSN